MVFFIFATLLFIVMFFPFGDLSDAITSEVVAATNNSVYLQFDDLSLGFAPQPSLKMENVLVEGPALPLEVTMSQLWVAPSILSLVKQQIGGTAKGEGLYDGQFSLSVSKSSKLQTPEALWTNLNFQNFNLKEITKSLASKQMLPFTASGSGQIKAELDIDPTAKLQPDGNFEIQLKNPQIPTFTLTNETMGSLSIPSISMEKIVLKGRVKDGRVIITDSTIGTPKDELYIKISGEISLMITPGFAQTTVTFYNLAIDMNVKDAFSTRMGVYMTILDGMLGKFKTMGTGQNRYAFRIEGRGFDDPMPRYSPL